MAPMKRGWSWEKVQGEPRRAWLEPAPEVLALAEAMDREGLRRVYDLGCGLGRHAVYLASRGFEVAASDVAPAAVEHTKDWLRREDLAAGLVLADFGAVPFRTSSFDAVLAYNVVYHTLADGVALAVQEMLRVLQPGGLLLATFKSTGSADFGAGRRVDDLTFVDEGGIEDGIPHHYVDRERLEALLAGFRVERLIHQEMWTGRAKDGGPDAHWIVWARGPQAAQPLTR